MSRALDVHLVVFARNPEPGRVKTRLAATLGAGAALDIYRTLAEGTLREARRLAGARVVVCCTPDEATGDVRAWLGQDLEVEGQGSGSLGPRMHAAMARRFAGGARRVLLVGTDCPGMDAGVLARAVAALDGADVVFGPAVDGGYYLVGASREVPEIFQSVPWSAPDTLTISLERAAAAGLSTALLGLLPDIDTEADWLAWRARAGHA